ncbi:MAG: AIPR family protein [Acidobacteriaceae bacterium]
MSDNDRVLLDDQFNKFKAEHPEVQDEGYLFEYFAAMNVLKPLFELDDSEVFDGLTRDDAGKGSRDGGIDAVYAFVNGSLIKEDTSAKVFDQDSVMQFVIVQATRTTGFDEWGVQQFRQSMKQLLDLNLDARTIKNTYNDIVREKFSQFRAFIRAVNPKKLIFHFFYVSRGDQADPNVTALTKEVREVVLNAFGLSVVNLTFVTASGLNQLLHTSPREVVNLDCLDIAKSPDDKGFLAYVKLTDFYKMISTDDGSMRNKLFEANVRDYQGENDVNAAIKATLDDKGGEDFWTLNNGVTIVADDATPRSSSLRLENPRIVNGLQTSKEIHLHFSSKGANKDDARLLVTRVVVPKTPRGRDRIIYTTNSQTKIPAANLRATDRFQSDIEEYFLKYNYYYDRRKNFYKNQGKKASQIIGILFVAQAVSAIIHKNLRLSRAFPSTLMTDDDAYERVFSRTRSLETYLCCAAILLHTKRAMAAADISQKSRNNIRFHVALCYTLLSLRKRSAGDNLKYSTFEKCDDALMRRSIAAIEKTFERLLDKNPKKTEDQIGKSLDFEKATIQTINTLVPPTRRAQSR